MLNRSLRVLMSSTLPIMLACMILVRAPTGLQAAEEHVYYGYVPPSTDVARGVDELVRGRVINYTVPAKMAVLDVVGLEDGTSIEIWDIYTNQMVNSATIDRLEKKLFYMPVGTFFKIVASKRIAALLNGGATVFENDGGADPPGGTSTFYPAVTGGFRGREFIFNAAPPTHSFAFYADKIGHNFHLMALEETDWTLSDSVELWSTSGHLAQRKAKTLLLQSRLFHQGTHGGAGNDVVFRLATSGDVEVSCSAQGDFVAVPAVTGGYVGKLFYAPVAVTLTDVGRTAAFIVVPLEEGQVTIHDGSLNVIASHSFSETVVSEMKHWHYELGRGRFTLIAESTGDIAFMAGQTVGTAEIDFLGDDITFVGSKPNQEVRFYAPTMAIVFAPESLTVTIDGGAPIQMSKDDFRLLESGVHSISADRHVIVEVLAAGAGWDTWGSYLIEPADVDASFEAPEGFLTKAVDYTMYIGFVAVVAAVVVVAAFIVRRRR